MGKPYPSVLELLKHTNDDILYCIENHRYEEKQELQRRNLMSVYFDKNSDEDEYCEACHQSPCMCSDREKTSTVYDF